MKIIGLTGSVAMGKSEVAKIFVSAGIPVFDSDAAVHELYASTQGIDIVRQLIPDAIVHGRVDRQVISKHLLANPKLLKELEKKVHAEIRQRREAFLDHEREQGRACVALDIPLLFETGADKEVEVVVVVSSTPEIQRTRALQRPGMGPEKFKMILDRQMPDLEKRNRADFVIENNGSLDDLRNSVQSMITELKKSDKAGHDD
jgi:dephospho-CoA kinase